MDGWSPAPGTDHDKVSPKAFCSYLSQCSTLSFGKM